MSVRRDKRTESARQKHEYEIEHESGGIIQRSEASFPWYSQPKKCCASIQGQYNRHSKAFEYQPQNIASNNLPSYHFLLPTPPPNTPNPLNPPLNTLPLLDILLHATLLYQLDRIKVLSQLLIPRQPMHKTMTSPTQPRHAIQLILCMPPPLPHARMCRFGNEMVVGQGHPVSAAELAGGGARAAPYWGRGGDGGDVRC